jgi:hypothetical protein
VSKGVVDLFNCKVKLKCNLVSVPARGKVKGLGP